jgi:hypothetical protein
MTSNVIDFRAAKAKKEDRADTANKNEYPFDDLVVDIQEDFVYELCMLLKNYDIWLDKNPQSVKTFVALVSLFSGLVHRMHKQDHPMAQTFDSILFDDDFNAEAEIARIEEFISEDEE